MTEPQIWAWLAEVPDPEIPVLSLVDLGIIRDVHVGNSVRLTITPTYSGCPATTIIKRDIKEKLQKMGVDKLEIETRISPPWTTDWIAPSAHEKMKAYGIAPPKPAAPACPRCGAKKVVRLSQFGSTPCKSHYKCAVCLEPFDAFKCI